MDKVQSMSCLQMCVWEGIEPDVRWPQLVMPLSMNHVKF